MLSFLFALILCTHPRTGGAFGTKSFGCYYFDGCGGFAPHVVGMFEAAFAPRGNVHSKAADARQRPRVTPQRPIAVGFSLVGGNRDVVNKEVSIYLPLSFSSRQV